MVLLVTILNWIGLSHEEDFFRLIVSWWAVDSMLEVVHLLFDFALVLLRQFVLIIDTLRHFLQRTTDIFVEGCDFFPVLAKVFEHVVLPLFQVSFESVNVFVKCRNLLVKLGHQVFRDLNAYLLKMWVQFPLVLNSLLDFILDLSFQFGHQLFDLWIDLDAWSDTHCCTRC